MRVKVLLVLGFVCMMFFASCDSSSTPKYLEFGTKMLLPQAPIGKNYDFTFTVTYGEDKWDANTGFVDSDIVWGFDNWKLNGVEQTQGPANMLFEEGTISGTADLADGGLWSFNVTIEKGKKLVIETFYLPIAKNVEITTDTALNYAVTETDYSAYLSAQYGAAPYYWSYGNWTKDGNPVNDAPVGLNFSGAGYIDGKADNSEVGDWTFEATVFDTTVPGQLTDTKMFELPIRLKLEVPTNYPTIQAAADAAENGQTIYLEPGTYQGTGNRDVDFQGKTINVIGDPQDPTQVVIDCEGTYATPHRAFLLANSEKDCVFDGLTIKNGHATVISSHFRGGAIYAGNNVTMTIQNCIFEENKTESMTDYIYGGTIYAGSNNVLNINNCKFDKTSVKTEYGDYVYGGNIFVTSNSIFTMEDCEISNSNVQCGYYQRGGEFYLSTVEFTMKNVNIHHGTYKNTQYRYLYGGYMDLESCNGTFENVNMTNGTMDVYYTSYAYIYGSLGYINGSSVEFNNCNFANNYWKYSGTYSYFYNYAGFYMTSGSSKWNDCMFINNQLLSSSSQARLYSGIFYITSHTATFNRCHFLNNRFATTYNSSSYSYSCGTVKIYSSSTGVLNDCVFAYNFAGNGAAAISCGYSSANCNVNNNTFFKNQGYYGGAFYAYGNLNINNSVLWGNSANGGGADIYVYSSSYTPILTNSLYTPSNISGSVNPISCVNTDPYFKDTGDNPVTGDCTFSDATMTVTGTPGTSAFMSEIARGDLIYLTSDGNTKALAVTKVVSDTELEVAGYYIGTPGTGAATVRKMDFTPQHTSNGDANDSPCVDSGDNSKVASSTDIIGGTRIVDGNGNSTPTVDMGAYEMQ